MISRNVAAGNKDFKKCKLNIILLTPLKHYVHAPHDPPPLLKKVFKYTEITVI